MIPILTGKELQKFDRGLKKSGQMDAFIQRAGYAAYMATLNILKNSYGKRVAVVAGPGHNGDDGRVLAGYLARKNIKVEVIPTDSSIKSISGVDLIVDAAFGTGLKRKYKFFKYEDIPVLSVDVPTGLNCDDGTVFEGALRADYTVSFVALKPGFYYNRGPEHTGKVIFNDLGVTLKESNRHLVEAKDLRKLRFKSQRDDHKWKHGVYVVAGSENMMGAAELTCETAVKTGASILKVLSLNTQKQTQVKEVIHQPFSFDWDVKLLNDIGRYKVLAIGPGLVFFNEDIIKLKNVLTEATVPVILDASALLAIGQLPDPAGFLSKVTAPKILTPHAGEFASLLGSTTKEFDIYDVERFAQASKSVILLKGPTTTVSSPNGKTFVINTGSPKLATAGTGDVLTGVIAGMIARSQSQNLTVEDLDSFNIGVNDTDEIAEITALAAFAHSLGFSEGQRSENSSDFGLTSSKLIDGIVSVLNDVSSSY